MIQIILGRKFKEMVLVVLLERCNKVRIKNRMCPLLTIASKGCIINTVSFHNYIEKRNRWDNFVFKEKHLGPRIKPQVCTMIRQGHVKTVALNL